MKSNCKHCKEEFEPRRRNHLYCRPGCKTMASYKRNGYHYVTGRYQKEEEVNQIEVHPQKEFPKNKKVDKKLKRLEKKLEGLKNLMEKSQKTTSGLLTAALGTVIGRFGEQTGRRIFWPDSLSATKEDIDSLKDQNEQIKNQNEKLLKRLEKIDKFNYL